MDWVYVVMSGSVMLAGAISLPIYRRRQSLGSARSLDETLAGCRALLALTAHFQQHRGMSSAWLSGDCSFAGKLEQKAQEIEAQFDALLHIARHESAMPHPCLTPNDLALFRFKWQQLREKLGGLSVEQSIARHSCLVEQLLLWLGALGEARVEPLLGGRAAHRLVRNYASRLPALSECLGQARAVGMSVATRKGCSAVARVRLMFLIARAEALLDQANHGGIGGERAMLAVQHMAGMVRTRMLVSSEINVTVQEYFDMATRAIDSVFGWIAETGEQLTRSGSENIQPGAVVHVHAR